MIQPAGDPRSEATRHRLIDAGIELFGCFGYDAVTTRQLAEAAGVNQAAITYHFGGKQGVYLAVANHITAIIAEDLRLISESVQARLEEYLDRADIGTLLLDTTLAIARLAFEYEQHGIRLIFLMREVMHPSIAFDQLYAKVSSPLRNIIGELIDRLIDAPVDTPGTILLAHAYLGQIIGFAVAQEGLKRWLNHIEDPESKQAAVIAAIERFSRCVIAGIVAIPLPISVAHSRLPIAEGSQTWP